MPGDRTTCPHRHIEPDGMCSDCGTTWRERIALRERNTRPAPMAEPSAREDLIRSVAASLGLTYEAFTALVATPSAYAHWSKVHEDLTAEIRARVGHTDLDAALEAVAAYPSARDEIRTAHERVAVWTAEAAALQIRHGFGNPNADLAEHEYLHRVIECPHSECDWQLSMEWLDKRNNRTTRLRGVIEANALAQAHLEEHALTDRRAQIETVLAEHIPNPRYAGCRCGQYSSTGEPAWRDHLAHMLNLLLPASGELLGYSVGSRTQDGRWHLYAGVDNHTAATATADCIRGLNETIPTRVYSDDHPAEFYTHVAVVEIRSTR